MSNQILVPSLGESITEATVSRWLKQVGEKVDSDEPLVELETDKVNVEVPSPLAGTLSSIKVKEGDTVEVGTLLGIVNQAKSSSIKNIKSETSPKDKKPYIPPQKTKKKNIFPETIQKSKKDSTSKQKILELVNIKKEENSNGALILDTLVEDSKTEINEEKYVPR